MRYAGPRFGDAFGDPNDGRARAVEHQSAGGASHYASEVGGDELKESGEHEVFAFG
jgi:hypothetical protein